MWARGRKSPPVCDADSGAHFDPPCESGRRGPDVRDSELAPEESASRAAGGYACFYFRPPAAGRTERPAGACKNLVRGGFQPRLPTSLPPPGQQQQQPSPLPRRQPVPLMPPAQLHPGAPQVVAPAPAVPLQSPPPSELMDVDPSAWPPSQAVALQPVLQPLSLGTPKESDTAAPCPAPTQQPSPQRQETLPLFVGPDAPSRPVPEAAPVVTGASGGNEPRCCSPCEPLQQPGALAAWNRYNGPFACQKPLICHGFNLRAAPGPSSAEPARAAAGPSTAGRAARCVPASAWRGRRPPQQKRDPRPPFVSGRSHLF
ncbi:proline-rich protein 2-like [Schistocerca americana]|uniref:proline-rich protein 2-like n=1 Tax=Schistocerca americana TaxID=7009 RepID=UPI001F4FD8E5|nr:proline-rich protein 2-like [Schistocerca americana]